MKCFFSAKKLLLAAAVFLLAQAAFSWGNVAFSLGSGYVFYGDAATKSLNKSLNDPGQIVLNTSVDYRLRLAPPVYLALGAVSVADFRWSGDHHVYNIDYAGTLGFHVYPGLAGLLFTVDYALGRRTTFYDVTGNDGESFNTRWGNGFRFGVLYDFGEHFTALAPMVGVSWRRMPRGGGADNILSVFFKLTLK